MKDIDGNEIEIGDIVLRPKFGSLNKHYVLGFSNKDKGIIVSCEKIIPSWSKTKSYYIPYTQTLSNHNSKQYLSYAPKLFIYKKNTTIPENLRKFVKQY